MAWLSDQPVQAPAGAAEAVLLLAGVLVLAALVLARRAARARADAAISINKMDTELRRRTAELEAVTQEFEAFAYAVSHDLRAPLRHVTGFAQLLADRTAGTLDEQSRRYLETVGQAAQRMGRLIDGLLMFSRLGRTPLQRSRVDLGDLVGEVRQALAAETAGRTIRWDIAALPAVEGDVVMMRQALAALVANAVKFTRLRPEARIEIGRAPSRPDEIIVFVRDNGVGFDPQQVGKLFNVFQRLHGVDEFAGDGLGLALVRRIIQRHGGRTWAEGQPDGGATFCFSLPADRSAMPPDRARGA
ncbi:MAG TPA: ATP-binding protein [Opitutaceae bacterium]|jgi:light-regulated signal transduction histidine kinase (bacteriophytochrome)|nr:ATP-binding protein [Opitutaceae bacterium]